MVGEHQKQVFVHDDPQLVRGYPARVEGAGTASPVFAQLDKTPDAELVVATDDGRVEVFRKPSKRLHHFPVQTPTPSWWPHGSPTARAERVAAPGSARTMSASPGVATPAVTSSR